MPKRVFKIISIIFLIIIFIAGILFVSGYSFYKSVFRLSYREVSETLKSTPVCEKIEKCELLEGDILIRRYVTEVTKLFDETLNPYFTHSAYYLGENEIFEAVGNYETPENQVKVNQLSQSDWLDEEMENFIIIRPKNKDQKINFITDGLKKIAEDPEYVFGLLKDGRKTVSCSDIILKYLEDEGFTKKSENVERIVTPDYLFWKMVKDGENFEIIGYKINPK